MPVKSYIEDLNPLSLEQLCQLLAETAPESEKGCENAWFDEIVHVIAYRINASTDFLFSHLDVADEPTARGVVSGISALKDYNRQTRAMIKAHIYDKRPSVAAAAIETAKRRGYKNLKKDVLTHKNSSDPYIYGAVLRYLSWYDFDTAILMLLKALRSDDPIIIQNGIDELEEHGYIKALPKIQTLLLHEHPDVRQAATWAVQTLSRKLRLKF